MVGRVGTGALLALLVLVPGPVARCDDPSKVLTVVVMDPLAAPLSCPCVQGYAQRDYEQLGKYLGVRLGRAVRLEFSESLVHALKSKTAGKADLVIGKHSVVLAEARESSLAVQCVASLTGKEGTTTQQGLFVVAADDPALTAADLKDYRIIFGPAEADEKHAAAIELLTALGVPLPMPRESCLACSEGATQVLELHRQGERAATVISSYAQPLLEGCGTIKKGDLRVIGETEPVPFVAAFVDEQLPEDDRRAIRQALLDVAGNESLCVALETKQGFVAPPPAKKK